MAKNQSDVLQAATGYLKGKVTDDLTVVSEALNNDIVQFFVKLMSLAGISPNGLYDNETNNYQFIQALNAYIRSVACQASFTERGVMEIATAPEALAQADNTRALTPLIAAQMLGGVNTSFINIGDWDMKTTIVKTVAHSLTYSKIMTVDAFIKNDLDTTRYSIKGENLGAIGWNSTNIIISRTTSGWFDSTDYDSTSFNRGWIIIQSTP